MDMSGKDKCEPEKGSEDPINYHSPNISSDWRFSGANLSNISMGMIPTGNPMAVCKGDVMESSSCPSASMVDSFCHTTWDRSTNSQNLGFYDVNVRKNASTSNAMGNRKGGLGPPRTSIDRTPDVGWTPPNSMLKGRMPLPKFPGMLPQSLSQFPADSGFIERAARFSRFSGGSLGDMMSPCGLPESMSPYSRGLRPMQGSQEASPGSALKSIPIVQPPKTGMNITEKSQDVSMPVGHVATEGSPLKNERKSGRFVRFHDEAEHVVGVSGNESDEAEYSGGDGGGQEEPSMLESTGGERSSIKRVSSKKRKRIGLDADLVQDKGIPQPFAEATKDNNELQKHGDQNPTSNPANTGGGKQGKQGPQASDSPKEEYIHIRARRGQATNSHSLAERVRREKISERMKFLQDLVPGCRKVTGKAVMLDEIINYVQSLQRQVEFLSMKLATVNPMLDFNIEGFLAKDIIQSRVVPSASLGFSSDITMPYPSLHPPQSRLIQAALPGMGNSSDTLRRSITSQMTATSGGYKEHMSQVANVWADELHNVVQMGFNSSAPLNSEDLRGSLSQGHMKAEL